MKFGLKVEKPGFFSCLTADEVLKAPLQITENPLKVCSALPAIFSLDEKKIRNNAIRHSLVKYLCYTMHVSGVKDLDNSGFVKKDEQMIHDPKIKRVDEVNEPIGDFIHNGFMQYGEQNHVVLNYDEFCFIAEDCEERIIGAITGRAYYNEVHIGDLIVDESHRRSGLGKRLVGAVEDCYKEKGYDVITLTTFGFQAPEFYKKMGYTVEFIRKNEDPKLTKYFLKKVL